MSTVERRRKRIYWGTYASVVVVFVGGVAALEALASGGKSVNVGSFIWVATAAGAAVAARVIRKLGLSLEAKTEDVVAGAEVQASPVPREGQAVVRRSRAGWAFGGLFTASLAIGLGLGGVYSSGAASAALLASAALCLVLSGFLWLGFRRDAGGVLAQADASGITGRHRRRTRSIRWDEVGRCEIKRTYDVLGRPTSVVCEVHDSAGSEALRVDLTAVSEAERQQFLDMVKGRGKTAFELEAADEPAGRGTELTAAQEPAGRGTELAAAQEPAALPAEEADFTARPTPSAARQGT